MPGFGYNERPLARPDPPSRSVRAEPVITARRHPIGRNSMQEINPIHNLIKDLSERTDVLRGYL